MNITIVPVGMLGTNCYIAASDEKNCVIIDPGANAPKISEAVAAKKLTPRYILLTHGHWDHTGAVKALMAQFPELELFIGEKDAELLVDPDKSMAVFRGFDPEEFTIPGAKTLKEDDIVELDELKFGVINTPGHTFGGVCYLCGDALFSGDTLSYENIGRCDLYGGDFDTMKQSLGKLAALEGDFVVYPGHGESTTLDHERVHNPYIKE